ncbi:(2E,6E)-farnesyl diphosphate synthase [Candidatus Palibaumannia cicadellinicola]|uniref:Octaprenyl diphosphate synthase / Dimethylallyltransferase / (2E,6E)-farnesyl diphosphate synthase / Geranylgeranyl diphosphate synthase n=1 Tax=Candidatus Palibaumannia cicadellinicola TaxID=186490 RepID=A0A088N1H4_9GAMM|nr:(2E,6E)-farnesyl diphosphate synthase [Candidatus Baumannia cicadellinicola]AIN47191.1 Octaprenyl diphosphate synthase / Dimethylallyltransferase / (2E,6E)-farnesyl diphosphate synthase / Geranylgeranyl diphosphate synthase [Candidatus Baumannia cicadellinicola]
MVEFIHELQKSSRCVDAALERYLYALSSQKTKLVQAMHYSTLLGGKRLRPFLVYQTGQLFGLKQESLDAPAAAIECIHAYSLIHDDLPAMDNNTLRRGEPTCHVQFGETTAILAGDALHTLAFTILTHAPISAITTEERLKMIAVLAEASGAEGMCFGQALDLESEGKHVSAEVLETIHRYKTGALIRAAVHMGALAAGKKSRKILNYLDSYAVAIGLAFQVQDDILDMIGDSQSTGKQRGADKLLGKKTYPLLLGLDMARAKAKNLYKESLASLKKIDAIGYNTNMLVKLARYIIERKT